MAKTKRIRVKNIIVDDANEKGIMSMALEEPNGDKTLFYFHISEARMLALMLNDKEVEHLNRIIDNNSEIETSQEEE